MLYYSNHITKIKISQGKLRLKLILSGKANESMTVIPAVTPI